MHYISQSPPKHTYTLYRHTSSLSLPHTKSLQNFAKAGKNTLHSVSLFIILSFCGTNRGWAALGQTKMSSLHSNTRDIVSAHTCTHNSVYIYRARAGAEWGLVIGKGEGGRRGKWHVLEGPAHSSSHPNPSFSRLRCDHPPLAPLLIEHQAPRPLQAPWGSSRATVWCGLWLRSLLGFKITHQRWGKEQEEGEGREREHEAKSAHTTIWFLTSQFVLMPRGFALSWLEGVDQTCHSTVYNRKTTTRNTTKYERSCCLFFIYAVCTMTFKWWSRFLIYWWISSTSLFCH